MRDVPAAPATERPRVAGKIGVTLLCVYLLTVTLRIDGCYRPDAAVRDERPEAGPALGAPFPPFELADVSGTRVTLRGLAGKPVVLAFVPSLDWSPPTKARLLELAAALAERRDVVVAVVMTEAQATPRALTFVREHTTPFYYLVDGGGLTAALGLQADGPEGTPAALPATFVLDGAGVVALRDVRRNARTWLAPATLLDTLARRLACEHHREAACV
jgi:peroxiredoxin